MKKNVLLIIAIALGIISLCPGRSQAQVSISGDSCVGSTLTLSAASGIPKRIDWYLNNTLLQVNSTWKAESVVVAGGSYGSAPNQLANPLDVFVDRKKNIYIVDDGSKRIQKWAPGATKGVTVAGGNGKGSEMNQFWSPTSVWVDEAGNVYVADYAKNRVQKWAPGAITGVTVAGGNGEGSAANQLAGPQGICMDKAGNLYIADRWNHRVQKWAPGALTGVTVAGGNGKGSESNQFYEPMDVGIDHAGNLYVIDQFNNRVQKWAPGATTGQTVIGLKGKGKTASQSDFFSAISVDSAGIISVVDRGNYRIQRWTPNATYGITVAGGNGHGPAANQIRSTFGLYVDQSGNVYMADLVGHSVRRFSRDARATPTYLTYHSGEHRAVVTLEGTSTKSTANFRLDTIPLRPQSITGPYTIVAGAKGLVYSVKNTPYVRYDWVVPVDATIVSGQGTSQIKVDWGQSTGGVGVVAYNQCGASKQRALSVTVTQPVASGDYEGYLDKVECGTIRGWVWDKNQPNTPLTVEFTADGSVIGTFLANIYRQDIKDAGKGNGEHVYKFETPNHLKDGKSHLISARVQNSNYTLIWAPKTLICPAPARLATEEGFSEPGFEVTLLGNPITADAIDLDIKNAGGQLLTFSVNDSQGRLLKQSSFQPTSDRERFRLHTGRRPNDLWLLRVSSPTSSKTLKILNTN